MKNVSKTKTKTLVFRDRKDAFKLFLEGQSVRVIAELLNINRNTIWSWIKENSWNEKRNLANQRITETLIQDYTISKLDTLKKLKSMQSKCFDRFLEARPNELEPIQAGKLFIELLKVYKDESHEKFIDPETYDMPYITEYDKQIEAVRDSFIENMSQLSKGILEK